VIAIAKFKLLRDCQSSGKQCWRDSALKQNQDESHLVVKLDFAVNSLYGNLPSFQTRLCSIISPIHSCSAKLKMKRPRSRATGPTSLRLTNFWLNSHTSLRFGKSSIDIRAPHLKSLDSQTSFPWEKKFLKVPGSEKRVILNGYINNPRAHEEAN
jgi:hypothetical protein